MSDATYRPRVLMLSGPVEPPWTRSDKNLVRSLANNLERYRPRVLTHIGGPSTLRPHVETEPAWGARADRRTPVGRRIGLFGQLLGETDADLVHLCWPADVLVSTVVKAACRARNLPLVHSLVRAPRTTLGIHRTVASDHVVCLSQETERRLHREGLHGAVWIPPGVERAEETSESQREMTKARLGLPQGVPLIIYAGDYVHAYAARTVAATVPRVIRQANAHFVMACRIRDPSERSEERRLREALFADGLASHVSFLNEVDDFGSLLSAADIQIFPADSANQRLDMPMVLLEGLMRETATVVANKPPFGELVAPGAAIGVPSMNPVSLAFAIVELLRDPKRRRELAKAGQAVVERQFDIRAVARQYEELYDRVLRTRRRQPTRTDRLWDAAGAVLERVGG